MHIKAACKIIGIPVNLLIGEEVGEGRKGASAACVAGKAADIFYKLAGLLCMGDTD
jgi:hypothetical protein